MALIFPFAPENFVAFASTNFPTYLFTMPDGAYRSALLFDNATSQKARSLAFEMPVFTGALTLKVKFAATTTSGNVQFRASVEAITPLDSLNVSSSTSFDTANSSGAISVPATTYNMKEFSITLTNDDSIAAGDLVTLALDRDVTVSSNVSSGGVYVLGASLMDAS